MLVFSSTENLKCISFYVVPFKPFVYWKTQKGYTLANGEDPDEMQHNAALYPRECSLDGYTVFSISIILSTFQGLC